LSDYAEKFSGVFAALKKRRTGGGSWERDFEIRLGFPDSKDLEYATGTVVKYVNSCPFKKLRLAPGDYYALDLESIQLLEGVVNKTGAGAASGQKSEHIVRGVDTLHRVGGDAPPPPALMPKRPADLVLGQRGMYMRAGGQVPCGTWGTVVGIYGLGAVASCTIEFLLDEDSFSGSELNGRTPPMRGLLIRLGDFLPANASAGKSKNKNQAAAAAAAAEQTADQQAPDRSAAASSKETKKGNKMSQADAASAKTSPAQGGQEKEAKKSNKMKPQPEASSAACPANDSSTHAVGANGKNGRKKDGAKDSGGPQKLSLGSRQTQGSDGRNDPGKARGDAHAAVKVDWGQVFDDLLGLAAPARR